MARATPEGGGGKLRAGGGGGSEGPSPPYHAEALSAKFEGWIEGKQPWLLHKVSSGRREMLLKGIVAVEMMVETVEGNFKLNQHKRDEDHVAVATALAAQDDPASQAIARRMVAMRPHLDYPEHAPIPTAAVSL